MSMIVYLFCSLLYFSSCDYAVVVDAGSTSSKMHIYSWNDLKNIQEVQFPKELIHMTKLSSYVGNFTGLQTDFSKYVNDILPYLPPNEPSKFYLGATAGLRLLPTDDAEFLIVSVRTIVKKQFSDVFTIEDRHIRVLSGEEEGVFGWITAQYVTEDFSFTETIGALDLGGASTQISFIPQYQQILADKKTIKLFDTVMDVYTHSFLRFGTNEAYRLSLGELLVNNAGKKEILNPCVWEGYNDTETIPGVSFIGTSDVSGCIDLVDKILHLNQYCFYPNDTCSVDSEYVPKVQESEKFYAFSGFYWMIDGVKLGTKDLKLSTFKTKLESFCKEDYAWALKNSGFSADRVWSQCFDAIYGLELLVTGYGFELDSNKQIQFVKDVEGKDVGWALGSLLFEQMFVDIIHTKIVTKIEKEKDQVYETPMIIGFSLLFVALIVILILIILNLVQCVLLFSCFTYSYFVRDGAKTSTVYERVDGDSDVY